MYAYFQTAALFADSLSRKAERHRNIGPKGPSRCADDLGAKAQTSGGRSSADPHEDHRSSLPALLEALYDEEPDVRLEAAYALMNFHDIGEKFYTQAFSRHRMVETLKDVFRREKSASVRTAIIRVFSLMNETAIVPFLLEVLASGDPDLQADCIYTLGLFRDPNIIFYVEPFLSVQHSRLQSNAIIALWQFSHLRPQLEEKLSELLKHNDVELRKAGIFTLGEVRLIRKRFLLDLMNAGNDEIRREAAFALSKWGNLTGFQRLLQDHLEASAEKFETLRRFFHHAKPQIRRPLETIVVSFVAELLNAVPRAGADYSSGAAWDPVLLEKLRRLSTLLDEHEELFIIEKSLKDNASRTTQSFSYSLAS
ncbi:HEAT repeat domain-containing protein [Candidatus Peregrinibacteria bacterium]|nr:HEAT repeat domain-containing protein [Candidatus Peregrinibacteria bacterium]